MEERLPVIRGNQIYMSAKTGAGIPELAAMISRFTGRNTYDSRSYF